MGFQGKDTACFPEQSLQIHVIALGNTTAVSAGRVGTMC